MNKLFTKIATAFVGMAMAVGVGVAVGVNNAKDVRAAEGDELLSFSSASVVGGTATSYTSYSDDDWDLNIGGNKVSAGWNKTAANARQVGSTYAIDATSVTATTYGWVAATKAAVVNAGKLVFSYTSGSGNGSGKLWLGYSTDGTTYSKVTLTDGTQGMSCGSTGTDYTFEFDTIASAYYAIIVTGGTSGSAFRFDSVTATLYEGPGSSTPTLTIKNTSHSTGPFTMVYNSEDEQYLNAWDGDTLLKDGLTWTFSNNDIVNHVEDSYTWTRLTPKAVGSVDVTVSCEGYKDATVVVTVTPGNLSSITVTGSMSKKSYYVGEAWDPTGLVATANYDSGYSRDATSDVAWSYDPASPTKSVTSVVATATLDTVSGNSSAQAVTVTRTNPIQVLYTQSSGASVDVYGYYVGFLDGTGPVIMDGEYGIVIYNKTADVSGYTEKETILHVTGSISIYKGLYEIGSASISVASGSYDAPDTPVVYATAGGETADKASRLTTVTGTPTLTSGSFDVDPGTGDIKMNFTVGTKTVQVFYKKAAQTADAEAFAAIKAAVAGSAEITIKGFTGWYDGFQVQMNGYVPPAEGYTAEDFSQDLLDQTDEICKDFVPGESSYNDFKVLLEAIWSDLASNDKYPSLPSSEKTILAEAARDESGTVVEQAMARYDYLTGKYSLSNFINGRTPVSFEAHFTTISSEANTTNAMIIVTVIALTSVSAIAVLLVIKRRKTY